MAFCPKCGAQVSGRFCGSCGADIEGASGGPTPSPFSQPGAPPPPGSAAQTGLPDNLAGALCYALGALTGILFLVLEPYNRNRETRFHAWQSIFLFCGMFVLYVGLTIVGIIMPHFFAFLVGAAILVLNLAIFLLWLFLLFRTYNGQKTVLPIIGPLAEQKAG